MTEPSISPIHGRPLHASGRSPLSSIELFAGGGGLALGVTAAGFAHECMVEWNRHAAKTLETNRAAFSLKENSTAGLIAGDIHQVDFRPYEDKVDLLSGGPPCQPFSVGGKAQAYNDKRDLFSEATRALRQVRPRAFLFENVRGLLRKGFAKYFEYILLQLTYPDLMRKDGEAWQDHLVRIERHHTDSARTDGLRYNVIFRLVNAADYGIPQKRERVFIIGFRSDVAARYAFPQPTHSKEALHYEKFVSGSYWRRHGLPQPAKEAGAQLCANFDKKPWVTLRDALKGLPSPLACNGVPNHTYQGGARAYVGHTGSLLDEPSKTIKAGAHGVPGGENMFLDDSGQTRYFTVREAARIQTFPDDYAFPCAWSEAMRQIGNAVPVGLATVVAQSIHTTLRTA